MATSPLFGWQEPDDTSLVKDGAAAIRTLGNAIDTSMGDLLGGTTGQVLAKASNTNMDFTWVAQDDSNAIQNAIVDAKGDLIAATAADTPARLAVGTNGQVLTADSTAATGMKWATPASTGSGMTLITTVNLSASGNFNINGCFSATYDNYLVKMTNLQGSTALTLTFGYRSGSTNSTSNYDSNGYYQQSGSATITGTQAVNVGRLDTLDCGSTTTTQGFAEITINAPFKTTMTTFNYNAQIFDAIVVRSGDHSSATSFDSMWFTLSTGTITGNISIYGLAK